jgi:hypothetical protein
MPPKLARLQSHELLGEPELDALLSDPVMMVLWRADHIDPDEARRLFARTTSMLRRRKPSSRTERGGDWADDRIAASPAFAMN